jgi:hypothetical protein
MLLDYSFLYNFGYKLGFRGNTKPSINVFDVRPPGIFGNIQRVSNFIIWFACINPLAYFQFSLMETLMHAMKKRGKTLGMVTLCGGMSMATAPGDNVSNFSC